MSSKYSTSTKVRFSFPHTSFHTVHSIFVLLFLELSGFPKICTSVDSPSIYIKIISLYKVMNLFYVQIHGTLFHKTNTLQKGNFVSEFPHSDKFVFNRQKQFHKVTLHFIIYNLLWPPPPPHLIKNQFISIRMCSNAGG